VTTTWYNTIRTASGLTQQQKDSLDSAWLSGGVAVSQHEESNFRVVAVVWTVGNFTVNDPLNLAWNNPSGVSFNAGTTHRALITQSSSPTCTVEVSGYQSPAGSGLQYFLGPVSGIYNDLYQLWLPQYRNLNYPSGYAGTSFSVLPNFDPDYVPDAYETLVSDTVEVVLENIDIAVKAGLLLGSVNFILQWLMTILMGRRYTDDN